MRPTERLTDSAVRALEPPQRGQKLYYDHALPGLAVRVSQGGSKSFILQHGSDRRMMTLGRYPIISLAQARDEARKMLAEFTLGRIRPQSITMEQAVTLFIEDKTRSKRAGTVREYERLLNRHFPYKGQINGVTAGWVLHRLNGLKDTPSEYNHALTAGKVFFNWCTKRRYITDNPLFALSPNRRPPRKRVLTDDELVRVWRAAEQIGGHFGTIVRLLICCGQREGETAALRTDYFKNNLCVLPANLTKNGREHTFPIGNLASSLLSKRTEATLLFPARGKTTSSFNNWGKPKRELDRLSGVTGWTLHDIRRTFKTNLSRLGVPPYISERLLNHVSHRGELEDTYDLHTYLPEMRKAVEAWDAQLTKLLTPLRQAA